MEKFAHSKKWKKRQTFALLCNKLLASNALPPEQFAPEIMPHLLDLSWDPVANVRLVVAKTLTQHIIPNGKVIHKRIYIIYTCSFSRVFCGSSKPTF